MKTERELFGEWARINIKNYCDAIFDGQYYVMRENSRLTKEKKNFLILSLNMGLRSWCASSSREGYKLVPVEATEETYIKYIGARIEAKDLGLYDMQFFNHVYKAMMGDVE